MKDNLTCNNNKALKKNKNNYHSTLNINAWNYWKCTKFSTLMNPEKI